MAELVLTLVCAASAALIGWGYSQHQRQGHEDREYIHAQDRD